jgi:hypothetical protein
MGGQTAEAPPMNRKRDEQCRTALDQPIDATILHVNRIDQSPLTPCLYAHYRKCWPKKGTPIESIS